MLLNSLSASKVQVLIEISYLGRILLLCVVPIICSVEIYKDKTHELEGIKY